MKIRINDRPDIQEIEVIINCVADDPLVNKIISALNTVDAKLLCRRQGETFQLGLADILYIESVDKKTFLYTEEQVYETDRRLYELEDYLKDHSFFGHLRQRSSIYGEQNQFGQRLGPDFCSLWIIRKKLLYHANMLEALNTLWG